MKGWVVMKLRNYEETINHYKDLFYAQWYGKGLKEKTISFIEENFVDIEGFSLYLGYELLYEFSLLERIYFFKFLRSELWSMGMNLTKNIGCEYYVMKRTKKDTYSKFLNYTNVNFIEAKQEIPFIQMITGKSYDEALNIFNKAIEIEPEAEKSKTSKDTKTIRPKRKHSEKSNFKKKEELETIENVEENVNNIPDISEILEKTLTTDDSE